MHEDVEKYDISPHDKFIRCFSGVFMLFSHILCCSLGVKEFFLAIYAFLSQNLFCRDLRAFAWRKIEPKIVSVEKK